MDNNVIRIKIDGSGQVGADAGGNLIPKAGVGRKCRGKVVNFKPYGFFVETEDGGFGLVHGRNIKGWDWHDRFDRVFRHGSEIEVTVEDIEDETGRMSFSCELPGYVAEEKKEAESEEPAVAAPSRQEIAEQWAKENGEKSQAAFDWLKTELDDGPIYGPLTHVLCDRFEVPVPASSWIRLFSDFACYSGKGDNPSDLPAVALSARAGELAYWDRIKVRSDDLLEFRDRAADDTAKFGALAKRLDGKNVFPGAKWIADYQATAAGLALGREVYGTADTVERLVIPMLGQLGWDVSAANAALVRGGKDTFDIRLYGGSAASGKVALAVKCVPAGTAPFASRGDEVEQTLGLYNCFGGDDPAATLVVWTNGVEWVLFTRELLVSCIGILAEHRGAEFAAALEERHFRRVEFPAQTTAFGWLAAFADLHDLIGCRAS